MMLCSVLCRYWIFFFPLIKKIIAFPQFGYKIHGEPEAEGLKSRNDHLEHWQRLIRGNLMRILASSWGFQSSNSYPSSIFHHHPRTETKQNKFIKKRKKKKKDTISIKSNFPFTWIFLSRELLQVSP